MADLVAQSCPLAPEGVGAACRAARRPTHSAARGRSEEQWYPLWIVNAAAGLYSGRPIARIRSPTMTPRQKNSCCSYCGQPFTEAQSWPRTCGSCSSINYVNPLPVAVTLLPVDGGILCVRRTIEPARGKLALPGGFLELNETWEQGCARELREETCVAIDASEVRLFRVYSAAPEGLLLIFGLARPRPAADLPDFLANEEASEMLVLAVPAQLSVPLHTLVLAEYFQGGRAYNEAH